ncbi:MAG: twin-arginine translocase TatA/TatE family subunit [Anaerolineae bacterium]
MNVGPWELTVILIIAILLVGPKRMVEIARTIARVTNRLRQFSNEFTATLQAEVAATERAAGESPQNIVKSITEPFAGIQADLQATEREARQALESIIEGKESIQDELEATAHETRQALEDMSQNNINNDPVQED